MQPTLGGIGAEGGVVTRPTRAIIGEAGPEFVIPLHKMPGASALPSELGARRRNGSTASSFNITVNAGMGTDGADVGRKVVDAIKSYERSNGSAWRAS